MIILIFLAIFVLLFLLTYVVITYNTLRQLSQYITASWADIDVQLKRHFDLIPDLLAISKHYAAHEEALWSHLLMLRSQVQVVVDQLDQRSGVEQQISTDLNSLIAQLEAMPAVKADQTFQEIAHNLVLIEDQVASARIMYNRNVEDYNNQVLSFPTSVLALLMGLKPRQFFQKNVVRAVEDIW